MMFGGKDIVSDLRELVEAYFKSLQELNKIGVKIHTYDGRTESYADFLEEDSLLLLDKELTKRHNVMAQISKRHLRYLMLINGVDFTHNRPVLRVIDGYKKP